MGDNLLTIVGEHDEGNRSVESDSEIDVEQNPTTFLNNKIDMLDKLSNMFHKCSYCDYQST